jgi:phosphoglycolate phosphatase
MPSADRIRLVVFDCDGTLVDSQHMIVEAMTAAFEGAGLVPPKSNAVRRIVGLSLAEGVTRLLGDGADDEAVGVVTEGYRAAFAELRRQPHHEPLFPGADTAIDRLEAAGFLLGVATGKSLRGLRTTLGRHGLERRFITLQTADTAAGKPHPEMLHRAMSEAGAAPGDTVLVGDTTFDMIMARNAEVRAIGVSWGYHEVEELWESGARHVIDTFEELVPLVDEALGG